MALRGQPSTAHEYDNRGACKYCGLLKANILAMSLVCTPEREALTDIGEKQEVVKEPPKPEHQQTLKEKFKSDVEKLRGRHGK